MTFVQLQDRVLGRLNLSTAVARTRIKEFLNERYRATATSISLGDVRRGTVTVSTVAGTSTVTPTIIKPITVSIPSLDTVLDERTLDQLRHLDPGGTWTGDPQFYAIKSVGARDVTLELRPIPDAVRTLTIDAIVRGVDLTNNDDVPVFPEDFHDLLISGALADEYFHFDKDSLADKQEERYQRRLSELRYFLAKSAYLTRGQGPRPAWWEYNRGLSV